MADIRVPPGYVRDDDGALRIAGRTAADWVADAGDTPLFLYGGALLEAQAAQFRTLMPPDLRLHYAVKANPFAPLVGHMAGLVDGFDVASAGEMRLALASGMPASRISFAGPGKRDSELEAAVASGVTLHCESEGELHRTRAIARQLGHLARIAIRINPPFELKGSGMRMGGGARPFGIDADRLPALLPTLDDPLIHFHGFHIFAGSQNLDAQALTEAQRQSVALVAELAAFAPVAPEFVNLGGGFGVPYFPADQPLDVAAVGTALGATLAARPAILADTIFALELGRWLVAEAGVYLCRVVDRKLSAGETFLVTDGGLHHQLAASGNFGTVIRRNYPVVNASRDGAREVANVVGCLCTPLDRLAERLDISETRVGDLIAVFMAGAYGRTASPEAFLGHPAPLELLV